MEADQTGFAGGIDDLFTLARTAEIEIDRLFAEDVLARGGGTLDEIGVRVGRRADQHSVDAAIGEDLVDGDDFCAECSGQLGGRFSDRVGDARQCHAGVAGGVCCMNLADATSADDCQTDGHGVSPIGFRYLRKSGS